jgi:hypothetical protein
LYDSARQTVCTGSVESVEDCGRTVSLIEHNCLKEGRRHPACGEATLSFGNTITAKRALIMTVKDDLELVFEGLNVLRTSFLQVLTGLHKLPETGGNILKVLRVVLDLVLDTADSINNFVRVERVEIVRNFLHGVDPCSINMEMDGDLVLIERHESCGRSR